MFCSIDNYKKNYYKVVWKSNKSQSKKWLRFDWHTRVWIRGNWKIITILNVYFPYVNHFSRKWQYKHVIYLLSWKYVEFQYQWYSIWGKKFNSTSSKQNIKPLILNTIEEPSHVADSMEEVLNLKMWKQQKTKYIFKTVTYKPENVDHQQQLLDHPNSDDLQICSKYHSDSYSGHSGDLKQHLLELWSQLCEIFSLSPSVRQCFHIWHVINSKTSFAKSRLQDYATYPCRMSFFPLMYYLLNQIIKEYCLSKWVIDDKNIWISSIGHFAFCKQIAQHWTFYLKIKKWLPSVTTK